MNKLFILSALLIASSVSLSAQRWWKSERATGDVEKRTIEVDRFDGVSLAYSGNIYLRQGSKQSVEVEMQESMFAHLSTDVRDGVWKIKFDRNISTRQRVNIYITMPELTVASVSGSGNIKGETAFTNLGDVKISVSGSGDVELELEAKDDVALPERGDEIFL